MIPLVDGFYDVLVVDADLDASEPTVRVELVVTAGQHKGQLVAVRFANLERDGLSLLGLPGTLTVAGGVPTLTME